jgi:hypothetical protein
MPFVNVSVFSPIARQNLLEVNEVSTFGKEMILTFTATESTTSFYLTKGWSAAAITAQQEVTLDYLYIQEQASQQMEINCGVLAEVTNYLLFNGINMNDSVIAKTYLNHYFKRNLSYAAYQSVNHLCQTNQGSFVLMQPGVEYEEVRGYRFGFNGQGKIDEIFGEGNFNDYKYRGNDPRIARFFAVDPLSKSYPELTPYQFASNTTIWARELEGLEAWYTTNECGEQVLIEGVAGPISESRQQELGATHFGLFVTNQVNLFSKQEINTFSAWNAQAGPEAAGKCLEMGVLGSEMLTNSFIASWRDKNGNLELCPGCIKYEDAKLKGRRVYSNGSPAIEPGLAQVLTRMGYATSVKTSPGIESSTIIRNSGNTNGMFAVFLMGPGAGSHTLITIYNSNDVMFSIYDQSTGWDVKNVNAQNMQMQIDQINALFDFGESKMWRLNKIEKKLVLKAIR